MGLERNFSVEGFGRLEWAVFGAHALVAAVFLAAALATFTGGGALTGAGLQALIAVLFVGLGLAVANVVGNR